MAGMINFVAFRLKNDATYETRREQLIDSVRENAIAKWWPPLTSVIVFPCNLQPRELAARLKPAINERTDLLVVGSLTHKEFVIIGDHEDDDIYEFCDFAKRG